jgi:hypothetical protein
MEMDLTSIEIDFDIHKMIEAERRSFSEKPYVALRRLLKLPEVMQEVAKPKAEGRPWQEDKVVIPHGSLARMEYARGTQVYEGQFLDGALVVNGQRFTSLSAAAGALAKTKNGNAPSLNGWNYWSVQLPGSDQYVLLEHLRKRAHGKSIF